MRMTGAMLGAREDLRWAYLASDLTHDTARSAEELQLPPAWRDDGEGGWQDTYLLKGVPP